MSPIFLLHEQPSTHEDYRTNESACSKLLETAVLTWQECIEKSSQRKRCPPYAHLWRLSVICYPKVWLHRVYFTLFVPVWHPLELHDATLLLGENPFCAWTVSIWTWRPAVCSQCQAIVQMVSNWPHTATMSSAFIPSKVKKYKRLIINSKRILWDLQIYWAAFRGLKTPTFRSGCCGG